MNGDETVRPLVTVICISYNQAPYIRDALEGFLLQRTDFKIEVIIHDDASTDGTADIIRDYTKRYPQLFRAVLQKENQYSQNGVAFLDELFIASKGKYITICEGDDYWTDPEKLQRQAELMERHPEYGLCFHPVEVRTEGEKKTHIYPDLSQGKNFTVGRLLQANFIQTNSVMYRKRPSYAHMPAGVTPKDWYNHLYHAQGMKIGFVNRVMSVYRRHPGSMWWESDKELDKIWLRYGMPHLVLFTELLKLYGSTPRYAKTIHNHIMTMFERLADVDTKYHANLLRGAISKYPNQAERIVQELLGETRYLSGRLEGRISEIAKLDIRRADTERELIVARQELALIKASRVWRLRNKAARAIGRQ